MIGILKTRTQEQISKKMINEERSIIDLELAIKKEEFRNYLKNTPDFNDAYAKVAETTSHELDMSAVCWSIKQS